MAIKDLIFLKQRAAAATTVVSGFITNVESNIVFDSNGKLLITGIQTGYGYENGAGRLDLNGVTEFAAYSLAGNSQIVDAKIFPNGDYAFLVQYQSPTTYFEVARVTPTGTLVWGKRIEETGSGYGGSPIAVAMGIDPSSGDVVVNATVYGNDLWFAKLAFATGATSWSKSLTVAGSGAPPIGAGAITIQNIYVLAGDIYANGTFYDIDTSQYWPIAYKFNSAGTLQWNKVLAVPSGIFLTALINPSSALTPAGDLLMLYKVSDSVEETIRLVKINASGAIVFQKKLVCLDISSITVDKTRPTLALSSTGDIYFALTANGLVNNTFVAKMSSAGVAQTSRQLVNAGLIGVQNLSRRASIAVSPSGDVFVVSGYQAAESPAESAVYRLKGTLLSPTTFAPHGVDNIPTAAFTTVTTTNVSLVSKAHSSLTGFGRTFTNSTPVTVAPTPLTPQPVLTSPANSYL